jgi:hypothetical protein
VEHKKMSSQKEDMSWTRFIIDTSDNYDELNASNNEASRLQAQCSSFYEFPASPYSSDPEPLKISPQSTNTNLSKQGFPSKFKSSNECEKLDGYQSPWRVSAQGKMHDPFLLNMSPFTCPPSLANEEFGNFTTLSMQTPLEHVIQGHTIYGHGFWAGSGGAGSENIESGKPWGIGHPSPSQNDTVDPRQLMPVIEASAAHAFETYSAASHCYSMAEILNSTHSPSPSLYSEQQNLENHQAIQGSPKAFVTPNLEQPLVMNAIARGTEIKNKIMEEKLRVIFSDMDPSETLNTHLNEALSQISLMLNENTRSDFSNDILNEAVYKILSGRLVKPITNLVLKQHIEDMENRLEALKVSPAKTNSVKVRVDSRLEYILKN